MINMEGVARVALPTDTFRLMERLIADADDPETNGPSAWRRRSDTLPTIEATGNDLGIDNVRWHAYVLSRRDLCRLVVEGGGASQPLPMHANGCPVLAEPCIFEVRDIIIDEIHVESRTMESFFVRRYKVDINAKLWEIIGFLDQRMEKDDNGVFKPAKGKLAGQPNKAKLTHFIMAACGVTEEFAQAALEFFAYIGLIEQFDGRAHQRRMVTPFVIDEKSLYYQPIEGFDGLCLAEVHTDPDAIDALKAFRADRALAQKLEQEVRKLREGLPAHGQRARLFVTTKAAREEQRKVNERIAKMK